MELLCEKRRLNLVQKSNDGVSKAGQGDVHLLRVVPAHDPDLPGRQVPRSHLQSQRHSLLFPVVELPARRVVQAQVRVCAHAALFQQLLDVLRVLDELALVGGLHHDRANDGLDGSYSGRQHQSLTAKIQFSTTKII